MDKRELHRALDHLAAADKDIAAALSVVGYPPPRHKPHGFSGFLDIIISQQISKDAATAIFTRIMALTGGIPSPQAFLDLPQESLREAGLSCPKISYGRALAEHLVSGAFDLAALARMPDTAAVAAITALPGFGRWSAEIYCMFALDRRDIFPAGDLAQREALRRLRGLAVRPEEAEARALATVWAPRRTAATIFLFHYYRSAPQ